MTARHRRSATAPVAPRITLDDYHRADAMELRIVRHLPITENNVALPGDVIGKDGKTVIIWRLAGNDSNYAVDGWHPWHDGMFGGCYAVKIYANREERTLRAVTGKDYGRIFDASIVEAVMKFAGNGVGDTRWKIPGVLDWSTSVYNPYVDINSQTTTLFASDRDVFIFLVDDTHLIEIGKLSNGDPDLIFRGVIISNSEVGTRSLRIASFWLRAACANRSLWGTEDWEELRIVHSKYGNDRFIREAEPALQRYADSEPTALLAGIKAAKEAKAGDTVEDRMKLLTADALGFSKARAQLILDTHEREEQRPATSVWDLVQGITAVARTIPRTDERLEMEGVASKLMDRATRNVSLA